MIFIFFIFTAFAQEKNEFICDPPKEIKDRVNEYCIQATQFAVTYTKPQVKKIKNGKLFFTSEETDDGSVVLKMAHQCRGKKISGWKRFDKFCGYENVDFDRKTPAIVRIRQELAQINRLNEKAHRDQIDDQGETPQHDLRSTRESARIEHGLNVMLDESSNVLARTAAPTERILERREGTDAASVLGEEDQWRPRI